MGETQELRGRWGQPQPAIDFGRGFPQAAMEFGKGFPQPAQQDFGRWGQPLPSMEFGRGWPFIEQGGRIPRMPFPPGGSRYIH